MTRAALQPTFPVNLDHLGPPGLIEAMSATELGAFLRLLRFAWDQPTPCSLPPDSAMLAAVARVSQAEWDSIRSRVLLAFPPQSSPQVHAGDSPGNHSRAGDLPGTPGATVLLVNTWARAAYDRAAEILRRCSDGGRAKGGKGSSRGVEGGLKGASRGVEGDFRAQRSERSSDPESSEAPTLQRSPQPEQTQSAREDVIVKLGAGARALGKNQADRVWCFRLLTDAVFPWASSDKVRLPMQLATELSEHPNATPMLVAYAIEQINSIGSKPPQPDKPKRETNPFALLIAALGAQHEAPKPPWEVPLHFATAWGRREDEQKRMHEAQERIDRLRAEKGVVTVHGPGGRR